MKHTSRNYFILLLLALLFMAPGLVAYIVYNHNAWLSAAPTNKGTLLNPPVLLAQLHEKEKWQLVLWSPQACDQECAQQLDKLARIRLALGRRLYEVETCLLLGVDAPLPAVPLANTLRDHDIHVLKLAAGASSPLPVLPKISTLYIMNPTGYLVLAYKNQAKPDDLYHDIKHLLKSS